MCFKADQVILAWVSKIKIRNIHLDYFFPLHVFSASLLLLFFFFSLRKQRFLKLPLCSDFGLLRKYCTIPLPFIILCGVSNTAVSWPAMCVAVSPFLWLDIALTLFEPFSHGGVREFPQFLMNLPFQKL